MTPKGTNEEKPGRKNNGLILPENQLFSSSVRFTIMVILYIHKRVRISELQKLLACSPGKLDHHIQRLVEAKYVEKQILFIPRLRTIITSTKYGRESFKAYIVSIRDILDRIAKIIEENP